MNERAPAEKTIELGRAAGRCCLLLLLWGMLLLPSIAEAHPFHVSLAEVEWNPQSSRLEVALLMLPNDLEAALRRQTGKPVVLEKTEHLDALISSYLRDHFQVRPSEAEPDRRASDSAVGKREARPEVAKLHWIGKELSIKSAWLFFEIELPTGTRHVDVTNRILFGEQENQVNAVSLRHGKQVQTLRCSIQQPTCRFLLPSAPR